MRVLVTGHRGYFGSVLCGVLRAARFDVVGLDAGWFEGCEFGRMRDDVPSFDSDVRDIEFTDLLSFDAVVHLAGLSDDACGALAPRLTEEINTETTVRLAEACRRANVSRLVCASSCAVYGRSGNGVVDEFAPARPCSAYAASKLHSERDVARLADGTFSPVFLRLATMYGVSPRLRLDTVVNDFVASAVTTGRITMRSAGGEWRPLVHVEDAARVIASVLRAPADELSGQIINVARREENYRVIDIADAVTDLVSPCVRHGMRDGVDHSSYRVDGAQLRRLFPEFVFRWNLERGIKQLHQAMLCNGVTPADWRGERFRRLPHLLRLQEQGRLSSTLRGAPVAA